MSSKHHHLKHQARFQAWRRSCVRTLAKSASYSSWRAESSFIKTWKHINIFIAHVHGGRRRQCAGNRQTKYLAIRHHQHQSEIMVAALIKASICVCASSSDSPARTNRSDGEIKCEAAICRVAYYFRQAKQKAGVLSLCCETRTPARPGGARYVKRRKRRSIIFELHQGAEIYPCGNMKRRLLLSPSRPDISAKWPSAM